MLHQTFDPHDLLILALLALMEGLLSIDNAVVLGLLARRLPKDLQGKALTYGLIGAFVCRLLAIAAAAWLIRWQFVKLLGGGYLIYIAVKHLFFTHAPAPAVDTDAPAKPNPRLFWKTVASIQVTDAAFAIDSILAGIALVGPIPPGDPSSIHPKLWVVVGGGLIGVLLMRVAAAAFIKLLERFPTFETSAYLLVLCVGLKLLADWAGHTFDVPVNFDSYRAPAFWIFWLAMAASLGVGFLPRRAQAHPAG